MKDPTCLNNSKIQSKRKKITSFNGGIKKQEIPNITTINKIEIRNLFKTSTPFVRLMQTRYIYFS